MKGAVLRRREFLASASVLALAACATTPGAELDAGEIAVLADAARQLYPHDALDDAVYAEVVAGIVADAASDPERLALLDAGVAVLRDGDTPGLNLQFMADTQQPFFVTMRSEVQARLYEHPAVWAMLGYPGPALPFGGYVDKGFDDIDWLPA